MKFGESESKYLKVSDLELPGGQFAEPVVEIESVNIEEVGDENEEKFVVYFVGKNKGMVCGVTVQRALIALFEKPPDSTTGAMTAHFGGNKVQLFNDVSVMYGSKRTGGLRLRAAVGSSQPAPSQPPPAAQVEDEIPF
ncbi:MAG: hypothetical protein V3S01_01020 [Dehalococcoidia bacterium]